jgi:hypothetical protein
MIELSPIKDGGGPAFPTEATSATFVSLGMTKRDYFAAKAMQSIMGSDKYGGLVGVNNYENRCSVDAYKMADAMLKARKA